MKMLETIHILPVRAESAAPAPLRGKKLDQRAVRKNGNQAFTQPITRRSK